jgi:hypothetical protein
MEQEKEGEGTSVLNTITEAAKTSMEATIEGVSSAATSIAEAVTGGTEKPRSRRKRSTTKKAAAGRGKAKRSSVATRRSTRKAAANKRTGRGAQGKRRASKSRTSKARGRATKRRSH